VISVARLSVTPVKALALLHPDEILLEREGVAENRRFYLVDAEGRLANGKKAGALVQVRAACNYDGTWLALDFPDGGRLEGGVELGATVTTDFWGREVAGRVCEGPWSAALSEVAGVALTLVRTERPGDGSDVHRVSLVSTASLQELARRGGDDGLADDRRFRLLVTLDGCSPHEEDTWEGRRLALGDAVVRVGGPIPRCVVTTLSPETGARDLDTLRAIKDYRGLSAERTIDFGVYAEVQEPGRVRVGDAAGPAR
jgi:uncharacterized protein YcbX